MADHSFKEFVLDQHAALPELRAKAMFGGHGLYSGAHFFAILDAGRVFFKVDATTRGAYEGRGMPAFTYVQQGRPLTLHYFEVPPDILEDRNALTVWATQAIQTAKLARSGKTPQSRQ